MQPYFSVIVPVYNTADYLPHCLDSIISQSFSDFELLLINDGSTDISPDICASYAEKDSRIRLIHKKNGGIVSARNTGVKTACGKYICYVDSDDWIVLDALQRIYAHISENNQPDMVIWNISYEYSDHNYVPVSHVTPGLYQKQKLDTDIYPYMMYDSRQSFCTPLVSPQAYNKAYKRELLQEHYCRDERLRQREEQGFVFECLYYADSVYFSDDVLYHYNRCNMSSIMSCYDSNYFYHNQYLSDYLKEHLGGKDPRIDIQLNACRANWLIIAIFHEVRFKRSFRTSLSHIREKIRETGALQSINLKPLPLPVKLYLTALGLNLYAVVLVVTGFVVKVRK